MSLPTFLGIGAARAGTTWLHELLASHPDIYVPTRRKEVRFFNNNYERGLQWYEKFFPDEVEAGRYCAIGEISPGYLHCSPCPERIARVSSIKRLILMIRNPIDRAYSHYGLMVQTGRTVDSFETFLSSQALVIQVGFYTRHLKNYLRHFGRDQILVLVYEHAVPHLPQAKESMASFLGVATERFPATAGAKRINPSGIPKVRLANVLAIKANRSLRYRWDLDWVVNWGKRLGIERLLGRAGPLPPMAEGTRQHLEEMYENEIGELESLLEIDLDCWRDGARNDKDQCVASRE